VQTGQASWYHFLDASCAHRTLPFGTIVTVTRLDTGATARCRVADRGPADTSRVIDPSYDTFILLARPGTGLIDVRLQW
jgi:rare lipoprotein A